MRPPAGAGPVPHLDRHDSTARAQEQRREEAVHVIELRNGEERLPLEQLEAAARIGRVVAEHAPAHAVGDPRRHALEPRIAPRLPVTGQEERAAVRTRGGRVPRRHQPRDVGGIVLAVAVHGGDPSPPGGAHPGDDGKALSLRGRVAHHDEMPNVPRGFLRPGRRRVGAAVVHEHDLVLRRATGPQRGADLPKQGAHVLRLVVGGDHHGELHAGFYSNRSPRAFQNRNTGTPSARSSAPMAALRGFDATELATT